MQYSNPIIDNIHRLREQHAEKFDYDLQKIVEDIQKQSKRINPKAKHFSLPAKKLKRATG